MKLKLKVKTEKPGWIKIHRKILDWEWYDDGKIFKIFVHCLLKANIKDKKWHGILIKRGSFVTSLGSLVDELNKRGKKQKLSIQNIRTALNKLKSTNEITIETNNNFTLISVRNYDGYQSTNTPSNKRLTNDQQTTNKRLTTTKEYKNGKKDKNIKNIYTSFTKLINKNSRLTDQSKRKIKTRLTSYSFTDLVIAMENFSQDSWWMENNAHRGVAWFFNSDDRVDQFLNLKSKKKMSSGNIEAVRMGNTTLKVLERKGYDTSTYRKIGSMERGQGKVE